MEDTHRIVDKCGGDANCGFFAVYDGHGGKEAAFTPSDVDRVYPVLLEEHQEISVPLLRPHELNQEVEYSHYYLSLLFSLIN